MTQERAVLKYMQDFGGITSFEAFTELGITRISARIFELRDKGIAEMKKRSSHNFFETIILKKQRYVKEKQ